MTNLENQSKGRLDKLNMKKLAHIVKERKNNQALQGKEKKLNKITLKAT